MSGLRIQEWAARDEASSAFRWRVHLVGPDDELGRVERVDWVLPTTFPAPLRTVADRTTGFALDGITWDDFECHARVHAPDARPEVLSKLVRVPVDEEEARRIAFEATRRDRRPMDEGHGGERLTRSVLIYLSVCAAAALLFLVTSFLGVVLPMSAEQRLLLIAAFSGAAGASIDALQAVVVLAGGRGVSRTWLGFFLLRPFVGLLLAALVYLVIRGGFFTRAATAADINALGVAIVCFIAGFASAKLTSRLQRTVNELFSSVDRDATPEASRVRDS